MGTFYHDSLRALTYKKLITSLFEDFGSQIETVDSLKTEEATVSYDIWLKLREGKVRAAMDNGKKLRSKLAASFSGIKCASSFMIYLNGGVSRLYGCTLSCTGF